MVNFLVLPKSARPPMGFRLATVEEAETIPDWNMLVKDEDVDEVRLLDGWISTFNRTDARSHVGFTKYYGVMLVIKTEDEPSPSDGLLRKKLYSQVHLTEDGKEAALLLSCQDENTEVIYWLLNENKDKSNQAKLVSFIVSIREIFPDAPDEPRKPYVKIVEKLLKFKLRGGRLEESDSDGKTLLHYAVELKYKAGDSDKEDNAIAVVEFLLEESSSLEGRKQMVNSKDNNGMTPLKIAIQQRNLAISAKLFYLSDSPKDYLSSEMEGIDGDEFSDRLQREAARRGYSETLVMLIDQCKLPPAVVVGLDDRKTVLHYIAAWGNENAALTVTNLIVEKWGREGKTTARVVDRDGRTPLHLAAQRGHIVLCQMLIQKLSIKADAKDRYGKTSLHLAVAEKKSDGTLVETLVRASHGILYSKDNKERTPLHIAATVGNTIMVQKLISWSEDKKDYVRQGDILGQTALHKAINKGHIEITYKLLQNGSRPLVERDSDGKTPLHYASQGGNESTATILIILLLNISQLQDELSLLLWASPPSIGTATECAKLPEVRKFLRKLMSGTTLEKLLRKTAKQGNLQMTMELLNRDADIKAIDNPKWQETLVESERENVKRVVNEIKNIPGRVTDQPTAHDNLGRNVFAQGLAALFLNPHTKSPVSIGISGEWGAGKSSLMIQTENIMLKTAAQLTCRKMNLLKDHEQSKEDEDPMNSWLKKYPEKDHHAILKSLAVVDRNESVTESGQSAIPYTEGERLKEIPAILTVPYNAWQYRNEDEAWAGLAVKITKEIEDAMTPAQQLCVCWKYSWATKRDKIWLRLILPALLAIILGGLVAWTTWTLLSRSTLKPLADLKYGSLPVTVIAIVWTVLKSVMDVVKPVSDQMGEYMKLLDHADKLGYQHKVMEDIKFLKQEITSAPSLFYSSIAWFLNLFCDFSDINVGHWGFRKLRPASGGNLRIIVFVDDLDRCEHTVILKVLSAVNLVLATCEINAILAMDSQMIDQAITRMYTEEQGVKIGQDVAEKYMRKIFQLPLSLPDPSDRESLQFLNRQLGASESSDQPTSKSNVIEHEKQIEKSEWEGFEILFEGLKPHFESAKAADFTDKAPKETETEKEVPEIKVDGQQRDDGGNESPTQDDTPLIHTPLIHIALAFPHYSAAERKILNCLRTHSTDSRKVPREWKRFLNYHRLAWNILSNYEQVKVIPGWQAQLVVWIFVCWEWRGPMNKVIKNWERMPSFSSEMIESDIHQDEYGTDVEGAWGPSLKEIVKKRYEEEEWPKNGSDTIAKEPRESWERLIKFLEDYNVSMQPILAFQQFRFECEKGYIKGPNPPF